ncbi:MAG: BrnA antitoxin family protein [Fibrobacter sp.]|nr:BrnA antitoxin family protein [Fibrobacter sp.]
MDKEELKAALIASGHKIVENTLSAEELEDVERELDESVGIDDARLKVLVEKAKTALSGEKSSLKMVSLRLDPQTVENMKKKAAELGMPYQAVARKVLQAAFS